jgi:integrase
LLQTVPRFPHLKEPAARTGFLESGQRDRLAEECGRVGLWMRSIFECAVSFGFRLHELTGHRGLKVSQLDFLSNTITLHADQTKNGCSRKVIMTGVVRELLLQCVTEKSPGDHVFTRPDGAPMISFGKVWRTCCARAGVPDLLFHDLRRAAVRSLVRSGVSEGVAMKISGHKTRSVFERYNITSEADLIDASRKLEAARAREEEEHAAQAEPPADAPPAAVTRPVN